MYDVTTNVYRQKISQAVAGAIALPTISTVVIGTGGVDGSGDPLTPAATDTGLYHQVLSKPVSGVTYPTSTSVQFSITVNPNDLPANTPINEIGLFDNAGDFVTHSTFYSKATDGSTTMTFNVQLQF
jgi:hypothetical protein